MLSGGRVVRNTQSSTTAVKKNIKWAHVHVYGGGAFILKKHQYNV